MDSSKHWNGGPAKKPRSGSRIQPRAQALGNTWAVSEPRRGERRVGTQPLQFRRIWRAALPLLRKLNMTPGIRGQPKKVVGYFES